ncbi:MAG: hypothetical protein MI867_05880 [Pseudomonadales bacterium]|nr:hypothetical protein [Pseudomonadales bacterium]
MSMSVRNALIVCSLAFLLSGCKNILTVEVQGEGQVSSTDQHIQCPSIACSHDYSEEDVARVTITAQPAAGYELISFGEVTCLNADAVPSATCELDISEPQTILATFAEIPEAEIELDDEDWQSYFKERQSQIQAYLLEQRHDSLEGQLIRFEFDSGPLHMPAFEAAEAKLNAREDTADFRTPALVRMLYEYQNSPLMTDELYQRIKTLMLNFKYWPDEPGNDPMIMWSENHQILFLSAGYLLGQLFPDEVFTNSGQTGAELKEKCRRLLMRWFGLRAKTGYAEWHSNVYYEEDLGPLITLIDFAEDPVIRKNAKAAADILMLDIALYSHDGAFGGSHGRTYRSNMINQLNESTSGTSYIAFEQGPFRTRYGLSAYQLVLSDNYMPAPAILKLGRKKQLNQNPNVPKVWNDQSQMGFSPKDSEWLGLSLEEEDTEAVLFWWANGAYMLPEIVNGTFYTAREFGLFEAGEFFPLVKGLAPLWQLGFADEVTSWLAVKALGEGLAMQTTNTYLHQKPAGMLSVAQDKNPGSPSFQHVMWSANLDEGATVYTTHPFLEEDYALGYFTGGASVPRIAQHNDVALILYKPKLPWLGLANDNAFTTHAFFPQEKFDEVVQQGKWFFGRKGDGYIALYSFNRASFTTEGEYANSEIVAKGFSNLWIAELGWRDEDGDFQAFVERVSSQTVDYDWAHDLQVTYQSDMGVMSFSWTDDLVVNGAAISLKDYPRYNNPFVQQPWGEIDVEVAVDGTVSTIEFELEE